MSYWVALTMLQKIRKAMSDRDSNYKLQGIIEMDDSFFGGKKPGDKRGRGSSKSTVLIEASTDENTVGYARMSVVDTVDGESIKSVIGADVVKEQIIKTDSCKAYRVIQAMGHSHQINRVKGKAAHTILKWVHVLSSNAKAFLKGTYHGIDKKHLQAYLDEYFCSLIEENGNVNYFIVLYLLVLVHLVLFIWS